MAKTHKSETTHEQTVVETSTEGNTALQASPPAETLPYDPAKLAECQTTSAKIRYLAACGMKNGPIAKLLGKRFQHVRNVLVTPLKSR